MSFLVIVLVSTVLRKLAQRRAVDIYRHPLLNISQDLASFDVTDYLDCAFECLANLACFSFNFAILADNSTSRHVCHLLASDKYNHSSRFVPSDEFHHYAIATPCEYTPCQQGSTCIPLYETHGFVCHCVPGYIGDFCHIKLPLWMKVNTKEVCFGARGNSYGTFSMPHDGEISSIKLVHLSGRVSCAAKQNRSSNWGCDVGEFLATYITSVSNKIVFPDISGVNKYKLSGIWSNSPELTFNNLTVPMKVSTGEQFRVWYGEDLKGQSEHDNGGKTCSDVFALYV